jgi:hypothetical protein
VKRLRVETRDGQVHVFEGDNDEIDTVREHLDALGRRGAPAYARLVNREGRRVIVYAGSVRKVT